MLAVAISAVLQSQYCQSASAGLAKQQLYAAFTSVRLYLWCIVCLLLTMPKKSLAQWGNQTPSNPEEYRRFSSLKFC